MKPTVLAVLFTLVAGMAGCMERDAGAPAAAHEDAPSQAAASPAPVDGLADVRASLPETPPERKLVQNAELRVEVGNYAAARGAVDEALAVAGGYLVDAQVQHRDGEVSQAMLTLRVPADRMARFLEACAGQGTVLRESLGSEDVTDQYYDVKARLANARKLEARLLDIVATKSDTVSSLLEVERELARVREEIERFEGKMRLWDTQVAFSLVKLELATKQVYAATTPPSFGERIAAAFAGSLHAMATFGKGAAVLLVTVLPWFLPLGLLALVAHRLTRRLQRKSA